MERQIKFRGLRVDNNEWVYGDLVHTVSVSNGVSKNHTLIGKDLDLFEVHSDTVGQFTGLKDKSCNYIYEGDIFDINQTVNGCSNFILLTCIGGFDVRYYYDNKPQREYEYSIYELLDIGIEDKEIKVTGNIHENK